jgi:hypothetical protein
VGSLLETPPRDPADMLSQANVLRGSPKIDAVLFGLKIAPRMTSRPVDLAGRIQAKRAVELVLAR